MKRILALEIRPGMFIAGLLTVSVTPQRVESVTMLRGTARVVFANGITYRFGMTDTLVRFPEYEALHRVANLNPDAGEIGPGMLKTIVAEARDVLEWK